MRTTGPSKRIKPRYTRHVPIPPEHKPFPWNEKDTAPLEKYVYRVLAYGNFRDIKKFVPPLPRSRSLCSQHLPRPAPRRAVLDKCLVRGEMNSNFFRKKYPFPYL